MHSAEYIICNIEPTKRTEEIQNHTTEKHNEKNQTHWQIIIFISAFINGLLIIVITGKLFDEIIHVWIQMGTLS